MSSQSEAGGHKILIVDDEVGIRRGCERILRSDGYKVLLAESGETGLEVLDRNRDVDLVLVDLRMPGISGLEFIAQTRDKVPEAVFTVITAYATLEAAVESTKRGAWDFLTKPFTPDELLRLTDRAIERVRLLRERNRLTAERGRRLLELSTEKTRLRTVIDSMADGVMVCNAEQEVVLHNPAALRSLGLAGSSGAPLDTTRALGWPGIRDMIAEVSRSRNRLSREIRVSSTPAETWARVDVAPVLDGDSGQFLGTVTVQRDITEGKRLEHLKAEFVNMVAHEVRAPVAAIDSYLSSLLAGYVPAPEKQREMLDRSRKRLKALADLVDDLLNVTRMEAESVRREIVPRSVSEVLAEVVALLQPLADPGGIAIRLESEDGLPPVPADREELIRLFTNLVSNAVKYNRPGGSVTLRADRDGAYVRVSVADTGIGIGEEGLERLFSEFYREKRPETRHVTGTGLGLNLVKRIVDFYHGRVEVRSRPGEGSVFTVWLPSAEAPPLDGARSADAGNP